MTAEPGTVCALEERGTRVSMLGERDGMGAPPATNDPSDACEMAARGHHCRGRPI